MNIKYVFLGNLGHEPKQIGFHPPDSEERYKTQSISLLEKYSNSVELRRTMNKKNFLVGPDGNWTFTIMDSKLFILVLSNINYPLEYVYNFIDEIYRDHIYLLVDENGNLNKAGKNSLKNIVELYQNPVNIQTLNNEVNDIKVELKNSVNNIIANTEDAKDLEMKASKINENSRQLLNDSHSLRKETSCCQRWKWCIIFIIIILVVGLIIIPKFILDSPKNPIWDYFDTNKTNTNNTLVDDQNRI
jgi:hypothetical protein